MTKYMSKLMVPGLIFLATGIFWAITPPAPPQDPPGYREMVLRKRDRPPLANWFAARGDDIEKSIDLSTEDENYR